MRLTRPAGLSTARRTGFTLLEVVLAASISVFLLGGLYIALDIQIRQGQIAREKVENATVVRAVFNRISRDLRHSLTPLTAPGEVAVDSQAASSSATGGSTTTGSSTTGGSTGSSSTGGTGTGTSTDSTTDPLATESGITIPPGSGVIGDGASLSIFMSRVANASGTIAADPESGTAYPSDQRKITYQMASDGEGQGLIRIEEPFTTSDAAQETGVASTLDNPNAKIIASEVESVQFEYFDGSAWSDSWDGSTLSEDGMTPLGPPRAIRVRLWIKPSLDGEAKEYRKTIAILTGPAAPVAGETTTESGTTGTTNSTGGSIP